jgi:tripartite-type tricarboxylate transporter receptor subunit TctC
MHNLFRLALLALALVPQLAFAQSYPAKPVRVVVPFAPGGSADASMRPIAVRLGAALGQSFIVDNRGGAQSIIGADVVAKAAPDGYTLLLMPGALVLSPYLVQNVPFRPIGDFTPIAMLVTQPYVFVASQAQPFVTFKEMLAYAKSNPGKLAIGTTDPLGILAVQSLNSMAKIDLTQVNYKGAGPIATDVVGGHIPLGITAPPGFMAFYKDRKVHVLAVTGPERLPAMPDVPTVAEASGVAGYNIQTWFALVGPAGLPRPIVDRLQREIAKILAEPEMRDVLIGLGMNPASDTTPERAAAIMKSDAERLGKLIEASGITPQ